MSSSIEADSTPLSTTRKPLCFALLSAREVNAAPHLVTVALMHAAIAATHCALDAAHPIVADPARSGGALRELTDAEHFAALVLHLSDQLAELLDDYIASHELELEPETDALSPQAPRS